MSDPPSDGSSSSYDNSEPAPGMSEIWIGGVRLLVGNAYQLQETLESLGMLDVTLRLGADALEDFARMIPVLHSDFDPVLHINGAFLCQPCVEEYGRHGNIAPSELDDHMRGGPIHERPRTPSLWRISRP